MPMPIASAASWNAGADQKAAGKRFAAWSMNVDYATRLLQAVAREGPATGRSHEFGWGSFANRHHDGKLVWAPVTAVS